MKCNDCERWIPYNAHTGRCRLNYSDENYDVPLNICKDFADKE